MHNKLKLPLTAVFSFLLGSIVFFPWGSKQEVTDVSNKENDSDFIFDRAPSSDTNIANSEPASKQNSKLEKKSTKADTKLPALYVKYQFSSIELKDTNLQLRNFLKNSVYVAQDQLAQYKKSNEKKVQLAQSKNKPAPATIVVKYHFSNEELMASNLTIRNQLKKSTIFDDRINPVLEKIKKSGEAIPVVINDIKKEINNVITSVINNQSEPDIKKVNYQFPDKLLELSNQTIQKQLSRYVINNTLDDNEFITSNKLNIAELEVPEISENEQDQIEIAEVSVIEEADIQNEDSIAVDDGFEATRSFFDDSAFQSSNMAIQMQLRGYQDTAIQQLDKDHGITILEGGIEVIEYSEVESDEVEFSEIITYKKMTFLKSELKTSNLAILKQLRGYKQTPTAAATDISLTVEATQYEHESDLLMSNSEHDDEDNNVVTNYNNSQKYRKNTAELNTDDELPGIENIDSDDDDDDDDEYSGERIVFTKEPGYFTDSFEKEATTRVEKNVALPEVEDIENTVAADPLMGITEIEEIEIIEEIDISDDSRIITSAVN